MLRNIKDLEGYAIRATDGDIGHVKDCYFDDESWVVRYFIVDTGTWLSSRKVLISPIAVGLPKEAERELPVSITMEQVRTCPDIDTERPVSRQQEAYYLLHYGYPQYWGNTGLGGAGISPEMMMPEFSSTPEVIEPRLDNPPSLAESLAEQGNDLHLRAYNEAMGYHIVASDGDIGHVQGMLVDEETWDIRYLIVNTSNWWLGHQVLIAPQWIERVSWSDQTVTVNLTRQAIQDAPAYDPMAVVDRKTELEIWKHYARDGYWTEGQPPVRIMSAR